MLMKLFAGLFLSLGMAFSGGSSADNAPAQPDCCAEGARCCAEGRACCGAADKAEDKAAPCCAEGQECCFPPQACCDK